MSRRSVLILAALSLAVSAGTASAASLFFDMSATDGNLQAWPTGISPTAGVIMNASAPAQGNGFYTLCAFPQGPAGGTMSNISSEFLSSSGTVWRAISSAMSNNGNVTINQTSMGQDGWVVTGNMTSFSYFQFASGDNTRTNGINNNGDVGGMYNGGKYTSGTGMNAFVYSGGTAYFLDAPNGQSSMGDCVTALNTAGQAVGYNAAPPLNNYRAVLWNYTIGGGSINYTATDLQNSLTNVYSDVMSSQALAINSSGKVVVGASNSQISTTPLIDTAYFLYDTGTQQYTSLGGLMMYDPIASTLGYNGGHQQAINDSGSVVGYTGTQSDGTWHASIWENGTITDLNTRYASILPAGFVLNNATAIDNRGDIVGYGTDLAGNSYQAFEILNIHPGDANGDNKVDINDLTIVLANYNQSGAWAAGDFNGDNKVDINDLTIVLATYNQTGGASAVGLAAVPEPSMILLTLGGLAGLLAYAWRKRT